MMTKVKKHLINVQPKSSKAKNRFVNQMDSLHAMEVEQEMTHSSLWFLLIAATVFG